ncbi:methyltransferase domain-containing protein [Bacillus sp. FJAT-49736]|uniref:class I SAM-dependent methyltransferase n=1 Tax=Bacillus sp. FJAT-49736 TaxID=2833582 RepID=UPI001BC9C9C6|nr:methyltransferase domain-containing protein [Bacillus sp. FJAT-49736]MBS4173207.1 methyltransferase domain-containing protein [Bacillus sp. FJAT-49736]
MNSFSWDGETKRQWNENAENWHSNSKEMWMHGSRKDIMPFFNKYIPPGLIADLGCGDGYGSLLLSQNGYEVIGMDISDKMIAIAKNLENERLTFMQGNLLNTPFEDSQFNGVMAINSLEWTEKPLIALNEINRIIVKGGYGCFGILGPTAMPRVNSFPRLEGKNAICNTIMPWEFEKLALKHGWEKIAESKVYKKGVSTQHTDGLSNELKQALSFMTLFILKKVN